MEKIKLNKEASVVELNAARKILWLIGCKVRRENDDLLVFAREKDEWSNYAKKTEDEKLIGRLFVDEGVYSSVLTIDGKLNFRNNEWEELVDFRVMLTIITRKLLPEAKHPESEAIGRGRRQQDLITGYIELLADHELIEWVA